MAAATISAKKAQENIGKVKIDNKLAATVPSKRPAS